MSVLQMPPMAVMLDETGKQLLIVRLGEHELGDVTIYDVVAVWHAQQSAN